jgi:hypothetical protein
MPSSVGVLTQQVFLQQPGMPATGEAGRNSRDASKKGMSETVGTPAREGMSARAGTVIASRITHV